MNDNTFRIGLCMAGAVSAGAYTAGVMDYLIEALDAWEERKRNNVPGTPSHKVEIPVMGGASAGGMTALMAGLALREPMRHIARWEDVENGAAAENRLYNAWVNLTGDDVTARMLARDDMDDGGAYSLLHSGFIDEVARNAINPRSNTVIDRPYISKNLKIFATLSNLYGMPYSVAFRAAAAAEERSHHIISRHNDYGCFQYPDIDGSTSSGWLPFDPHSPEGRELIANTAMATGAFPVGLRARKIQRNAEALRMHPWFSEVMRGAIPGLPPFQGSSYDALFVDGGMINNEPFEKVADILRSTGDHQPETERRDYSKCRSTVLMIDPFPSEMPEPGSRPDDGILSTAGATLGAMLGQVRVKPEHLIDAMNSDDAGQYLISPTRHFNGKKISGKHALACGSLSGFGGFLSRSFRVHDFFLGRANCERFLREHFTIPERACNPVLENGYVNIDPEAMKQFRRKDGTLQIIPIFTEARAGRYAPVFSNGSLWPSISEEKIRSYRKPLSKRIDRLVKNASGTSGTDRFLLSIGMWVLMNRKATGAVLDTCISQLKEWDQLGADSAI